MTVPATTAQPWRAPLAEIPVRGRVVVEIASGCPVDSGRTDDAGRPFDAVVAAAFLAAAAVSTGTVVVLDWPRTSPTTADGPSIDDRIRFVLADMGVYVVRSVEGLTATSRSTSGDLRGGRFDLTDAPRLLPLTLVLAAMAETPSAVSGLDRSDPVVTAVTANIRDAGAGLEWVGDDLLVQPRALRGGRWSTSGDVDVAMAGAVLGLRIPEVRLDDITPVLDVLPAFDDRWLRLLWADEHLLPGTSTWHA
ncbi:3-phosphoshikimate 1-carboxyvinyltransferase [Nakamurella leprariae]|uniref:Enolpyruvate transferase domain-containing protein n=1 Tax=Nakamurella leprariae TaxID=2803911 RepID=A0A938YKG5_9ACTN|nr:hypothetical protein [Nakamurella leprariae]MBM9469518.1 hypothetical protein [Nakamurella leprariae]